MLLWCHEHGGLLVFFSLFSGLTSLLYLASFDIQAVMCGCVGFGRKEEGGYFDDGVVVLQLQKITSLQAKAHSSHLHGQREEKEMWFFLVAYLGYLQKAPSYLFIFQLPNSSRGRSLSEATGRPRGDFGDARYLVLGPAWERKEARELQIRNGPMSSTCNDAGRCVDR